MSNNDIDSRIKLLVIFKTYLYCNGRCTAKQFTDWLINKDLGLRKSYGARELAGILYTIRHNPITRSIECEKVNGTKYYYMRDTDD